MESLPYHPPVNIGDGATVGGGYADGPAGATGPAGPGAVLYNRAGMVPWFAALAKRTSAQARAVCVGDSITIGLGLTDVRKSWTYLLKQRLRAKYGLTNVADGYVHAAPDLLSSTPTLSYNPAAGAGIISLDKWGLGERSALLVTSGHYVEWAARPYTSFRVWYGHWNNFFAGNLRVLVNGVDQGVNLSGVGADASGFSTLFPGSPYPGNQAIRVQVQTADLGTYIEGVEFFDGDHASGIHTYNHAQSGWQCTNFTDANADVAWGAVTALAPQLVVVALGTNDMSVNEPSVGLANLDTLLTKIDAKVTGAHSTLLVGMYRATNIDPARMDAWHEGLVARAVGNRCYLDASAVWPTLVNDGSQNMGLMQESSNPIVHPNDAGHQALADFIANHIVP